MDNVMRRGKGGGVWKSKIMEGCDEKRGGNMRENDKSNPVCDADI